MQLRYKVTSVGYEKLNNEQLNREGGILFLPNHPAEVDPIIVGSVIWQKFEPRPLIVEWISKVPLVSIVMKMMRAVSIPNFDDKSSSKKRHAAEKAFQTVVEGLKNKDNFMIYPAGRLKSSEKESLGGASGLYKIVQANKNVNIVLVRTTGLWGSRFSKGWNGQNVVFYEAVVSAIKALIKNGFFFMPRRPVVVELQPVNDIFPFDASRIELNRFLESWYNQKSDPLSLVPYQFWSKKLNRKPLDISKSITVQGIHEDIQLEIVAEIARISKCLYTEVKPQMNLFSDLRMDSSDIQDLANFLVERYKVVNLKPSNLTTVASVMSYASDPNKEIETQSSIGSSDHWASFDQGKKLRAKIPEGSIPEAFFKMACQRKKEVVCADLITGEMTYERLMLAVILLSKKIQKMEGEYIGVLLPASCTVNIVILATLVAKKIPVMINWTVGPNHLEAVLAHTKLQNVITSKTFIKNISESDFKAIENKFIFVEELKKEISFYDKLKAYFLIKLSYLQISKILSIHNMDKDQTAALIFTSGTETMPKGVPLSHENIISNLNSAFDRVETSNHDIMLGFLPPFHSFGLTVTGLLPIISGMRVFYYPNPTHYKKIAKLIGEWKVTFLCGAPTFLKGILQPSQAENFSYLRVIVSGAEKAPSSLIDRINKICSNATFLEGYGLSECAPIVCLNEPCQPHEGVGPALDIVDLLVVHPDTFEPVPAGQKGHVLVFGPNVFEGYLGNFPSPFVEIEGKKWFKTGDLGYLNQRNSLVLVGRLKRQVKIGGEIVNLNALEDSLAKCLVDEKMLQPQEEERPHLAVCAAEKETRAQLILFVTQELKVEEINKKIRNLGFSNLYRLHKVITVKELPLMASGKIHYRKLEEQIT